MPKLQEKIVHCWQKTKLLKAWTAGVQREAASKADALFKADGEC